MADSFPEIATRALITLTNDNGFEVVAQDQHHVRLESVLLAIDAWRDPRGEVEVQVSRLGAADDYEAWRYTGMVGTASVDRLLEIAVERMHADPAILEGSEVFYEQLGVENRRLAEAWTAYYAGEGPQPSGKIPR